MPHRAVLPLFVGLILYGMASVSQGAITLTGSTVTFAWNPSAGAEGYYLVYAPYESEPFQGPFTGKIDVGGQTRVSFEIGEGAAFHVAVQAYNEAGTSQVSNVVSFVRPLVAQGIPPVLSIRANGSATGLVVSEGTPVTISGNLDQVGGTHEIPDVWIVADTPFGFHSFRGGEGWVPGINRYEGMVSGSTAAFDIPNLDLPVGAYTFYLAVDDNADRRPDGTWWEAVSVEVAEPGSWWSRFLGAFPY
jgi:hypothetical protein